MEYIHNPATGTVIYRTHKVARWYMRYGWRPATFEMFMAWQTRQYALYPVDNRLYDTNPQL